MRVKRVGWVMWAVGNPVLRLSSDKSACESRRFYRKEKSRHHLTGTEGANSIIFWGDFGAECAIWALRRIIRVGEGVK